METKDIVTMITALIGCITGITGLMINLIKYRKERQKIIVYLEPGTLFGLYMTTAGNPVLFFNLEIINKSVQPICVRDVFAYTELGPIDASIDNNNIINFDLDVCDQKRYDRLSEHIKTPILLKPQEIIRRSVVFPATHIYKTYQHAKNEYFDAFVTVYTSANKFTLKIDVTEISNSNAPWVSLVSSARKLKDKYY